MSTEVVPESVLRAFIKTYPDLFPSWDLTHLGLIPDEEFGWPIGFSRKNVQHLGGMSAIGINCASCHVAEIIPGNGGTTSMSSQKLGTGRSPSLQQSIRILGVTSHFNVEGFFGSVLVATLKTSDPENMKRFLRNYVSDMEKVHGDHAETAVNAAWQEQQDKILAVMKADPFGSKEIAAGELHKIEPADVKLDIKALLDNGDVDLAARVHSMLRLLHNMRAALHVPDQPPDKVPPQSGPGRNDAFGLLAASLLNSPQPYSPIKFGLVWNVDKRTWVHWDGNTKSPIARNLLASLGPGAPMHGKRGDLIFADVKRQTDLSEKIAPPKYPFTIDNDAAKRGAPLFAANCNSCHGGPESDKRLFAVADVGTDPYRAEMFTQKLADGFNKFLNELEAEGYQPLKEVAVRSPGKYWGRDVERRLGALTLLARRLGADDARAAHLTRATRQDISSRLTHV
jgi:hypothetical protein